MNKPEPDFLAGPLESSTSLDLTKVVVTDFNGTVLAELPRLRTPDYRIAEIEALGRWFAAAPDAVRLLRELNDYIERGGALHAERGGRVHGLIRAWLAQADEGPRS